MIVLDTNVISEVLKPVPSVAVMYWLDLQNMESTFTTSVNQAEILFGIEVLPRGKRQQGLFKSIELMFVERFENRVLSFDEDAARAYAQILAARQRVGRKMSQADAMIAAIVYSHGASLATRNVADFEHCGIHLINPWMHAPNLPASR